MLLNISEITEKTLGKMVLQAAKVKPYTLTVFSTHLRGTEIVDSLEREIGTTNYDSVTVGVWKSLRLAEVNPSKMKSRESFSN